MLFHRWLLICACFASVISRSASFQEQGQCFSASPFVFCEEEQTYNGSDCLADESDILEEDQLVCKSFPFGLVEEQCFAKPSLAVVEVKTDKQGTRGAPVIVSPDEFKEQVLEMHSSVPVVNVTLEPDTNTNETAEVAIFDGSVALANTEEQANKTAVENSTETESEEDDDSKRGSRFNYASLAAGAIIMSSSAEFQGSSNLLTEDRDKYSLAPRHARKWVVIGLSEDILVDSIVIANYERYSSTVKEFQVLGSHQYPVNEWLLLGRFEAEPGLGEQTFHLERKSWARYVKFRFVTHYEDEFYCTLSLIRVHGSTHMESIRQEIEESSKSIEEIKSVAEMSSILVDDSDGKQANVEIIPEDAEVAEVVEVVPVVEVQPDDSPADTLQKESTSYLDLTRTNRDTAIWLNNLFITKLSTCPENYNMISPDLNLGQKPLAYLCAKYLTTLPEGGAITHVAATQLQQCPDTFTAVGGDLKTNYTLCFKRSTKLSRTQTTFITTRLEASKSGECMYIKQSNIYVCAEKSDDGLDFEMPEEVVSRPMDAEAPAGISGEGNGAAQSSSSTTTAPKNDKDAEVKKVSPSEPTEVASALDLPRVQGDGDGMQSDTALSIEKASTNKGEPLMPIGTIKTTNTPSIGPSGSLESVFSTLTSKVLQLELDQSLLKRYLENLVSTYATVFDKQTESMDSLKSQNELFESEMRSLSSEQEGVVDQQMQRIKALQDEVNLLKELNKLNQEYLSDLAILSVCSILVTLALLFKITCMNARTADVSGR